MSITVTPLNDPPVAEPDGYTAEEDRAISVPAPGVLGNDHDLDSTTLDAVIEEGPSHGTLDLNTDGSFVYTPATDYFGPDSFTYRAGDGEAQSAPVTVTITVEPTADVVGRRIFYNNSAWDGYTPGADVLDDGAIAPDKEALLQGTAAFQNYTSYTGGINGVMIDIEHGANLAALDAGDFQFFMGNDNDPEPGNWAAAPPPASITLRPGEGVGGSDRITLVWPDYLSYGHYYDPPNPSGIGNTWLKIVVVADDRTGLVNSDVFYFGNTVGESGDSTTDAIVNATDEIAARSHPKYFLDPAGKADPYDYNRDTRVNSTDEIIARHNATFFQSDLEPDYHPALLRAGVAVCRNRDELRTRRMDSRREIRSRVLSLSRQARRHLGRAKRYAGRYSRQFLRRVLSSRFDNYGKGSWRTGNNLSKRTACMRLIVYSYTLAI